MKKKIVASNSVVISNLTLSGRKTLSSYADMTLEGEISGDVRRGDYYYRLTERNGIAKGTSDGENEAIYISNEKAIESIRKNIVPLLSKKIQINNPADVLNEVAKFDLEMVKRAGINKRDWGGNATLAASTTLFQFLMKAGGYQPWDMLRPNSKGHFYFPNIAFNMVCGGEHVPGTKQDIQEMFFFDMHNTSMKGVFDTAIKFFKQFEKNLVRDGLPTGTAKERGFVFPVKDNYEGLTRIKEVATQLGLIPQQYAIGTDNAFSEIQHGEELRKSGLYNMRFSGLGQKTTDELIEFNRSILESASNFITMEDPASEIDIKGHKLMTEKYGNRVQVVIDDGAVTQMRFIIPFLAGKDRSARAGNSVLIKLNQAGTFTETRLATEIVLGIADPKLVTKFLKARNEMNYVLGELKKIGVKSLETALANIKAGGFSAFFSHRSTEGSSEFLPMMPLMYGWWPRIWFKAGAPNGERNLQHYNPLIRAEEKLNELGIRTEVTRLLGLPEEVFSQYVKRLFAIDITAQIDEHFEPDLT